TAKKTISTNWDLNKYQDTITAHGYKRLLFPANLNSNHWIVFEVDLTKNQFCYGDSLGDRGSNVDLQHIRRGLANWLNVAFGALFEDLGSTLPIGRQSDGHSCGICVINAMEHAMFGVPLFTDKNRYSLRIQYFVEAVKYLMYNSPQSTCNGIAESVDLQSAGAGGVAGVAAGATEEQREAVGEVLEGVERVECMAGTQEKATEDAEPQDSTIEVAPQSPAPSSLFSDVTCPPSSDAASGDERVSVVMFSVARTNQSSGFAEQQRKRVKGSDDEDGGRCKSSWKRPKKMKESDSESGEDCVPSRSAAASRKLNESLRSGTFMADEGKTERFEKKCHGLDGHAKFRYKESWQVRHSKCSKWVTMREPYDSVRFGEHIKGCKRMGEKSRDGTIDLFFKPQDARETGTARMAQPSARKQIVTGARPRLKETLIPSIPFTSSERPCLGLGKDQDEQINRYISRVIAEGAGSHSDTHIAKTLFGGGVKYSELDEISK
ncbi:hypothetical protein BDM02DRAFT_3194339, partial [Thelephora ganbajun]